MRTGVVTQCEAVRSLAKLLRGYSPWVPTAHVEIQCAQLVERYLTFVQDNQGTEHLFADGAMVGQRCVINYEQRGRDIIREGNDKLFHRGSPMVAHVECIALTLQQEMDRLGKAYAVCEFDHPSQNRKHFLTRPEFLDVENPRLAFLDDMMEIQASRTVTSANENGFVTTYSRDEFEGYLRDENIVMYGSFCEGRLTGFTLLRKGRRHHAPDGSEVMHQLSATMSSFLSTGYVEFLATYNPKPHDINELFRGMTAQERRIRGDEARNLLIALTDFGRSNGYAAFGAWCRVGNRALTFLLANGFERIGSVFGIDDDGTPLECAPIKFDIHRRNRNDFKLESK